MHRLRYTHLRRTFSDSVRLPRVADALGFWRDYGMANPILAAKHIARVALRGLGIPPTAAGIPDASNAQAPFMGNLQHMHYCQLCF